MFHWLNVCTRYLKGVVFHEGVVMVFVNLHGIMVVHEREAQPLFYIIWVFSSLFWIVFLLNASNVACHDPLVVRSSIHIDGCDLVSIRVTCPAFHLLLFCKGKITLGISVLRIIRYLQKQTSLKIQSIRWRISSGNGYDLPYSSCEKASTSFVPEQAIQNLIKVSNQTEVMSEICEFNQDHPQRLVN